MDLRKCHLHRPVLRKGRKIRYASLYILSGAGSQRPDYLGQGIAEQAAIVKNFQVIVLTDRFFYSILLAYASYCSNNENMSDWNNTLSF